MASFRATSHLHSHRSQVKGHMLTHTQSYTHSLACFLLTNSNLNISGELPFSSNNSCTPVLTDTFTRTCRSYRRITGGYRERESTSCRREGGREGGREREREREGGGGERERERGGGEGGRVHHAGLEHTGTAWREPHSLFMYCKVQSQM